MLNVKLLKLHFARHTFLRNWASSSLAAGSNKLSTDADENVFDMLPFMPPLGFVLTP